LKAEKVMLEAALVSSSMVWEVAAVTCRQHHITPASYTGSVRDKVAQQTTQGGGCDLQAAPPHTKQTASVHDQPLVEA
jgi:hypothetical protein